MQRIDAFLGALALQPADWDAHIVTGPLMEKRRVRHYRRTVRRLGLSESVRISRFKPRLPRLLQQADAVVGMAGYNSCMEILRAGVPAVLLPRSRPRLEQTIRAERLAEKGLVRCLTDADPRSLRSAIDELLSTTALPGELPRMDGLQRLCDVILDLHSAARTSRAVFAESMGGGLAD